ncbi:hypothetical protein CAPTEDRAFT_186510 [Capitella teleta]|uniref:Fork-head domain-containing protein n=1 Tax=Capitella teleta TaxID=283909 RepID=R7V8Z0_CAPTE|nr:hypothetical protein CAPTEDRAFT_186510 [Capitella teleta]|eukprot:ELU12826.1 hypothetical protein CAPTEDRAFT_186510 [Capitella teleta]
MQTSGDVDDDLRDLSFMSDTSFENLQEVARGARGKFPTINLFTRTSSENCTADRTDVKTNNSQVKQIPRKKDKYRAVITEALKENGPLGARDIYAWIQKNHPDIPIRDESHWKSSVRHELTVSPHFHKTLKISGGWLWDIDPLGKSGTVYPRCKKLRERPHFHFQGQSSIPTIIPNEMSCIQGVQFLPHPIPNYLPTAAYPPLFLCPTPQNMSTQDFFPFEFPQPTLIPTEYFTG